MVKMTKPVRRVAGVVSAAAALSAGVAGVALAQPHAAAADKTIKVCVTQGQMRLVARATSACPAGEKLVSWNSAGARGVAGPAGATGRTGAPGPAGMAGNTLLNGVGAPNASTGTAGDFYLNTATTTLFGPKSTAGWGSGTSLQGPSGINGAPGATGATGATGAFSAIHTEISISTPGAGTLTSLTLCQNNEQAMGGGWTTSHQNPYGVLYNRPDIAGSASIGWEVSINTGSTSDQLVVFALCVG